MKKSALKSPAACASKTVGGQQACEQEMTFKPGDVVHVVGIDNITLIVQP